jgi:CRP-like cAMP-binding protein
VGRRLPGVGLDSKGIREDGTGAEAGTDVVGGVVTAATRGRFRGPGALETGRRLRPADDGGGEHVGFGAHADAVRVFTPLNSRDVRALAGTAVEVDVPEQAQIVREGELTETFFVIAAGRVELWREGRRLRPLVVGDCFGAIDPGADRRSPFTVVARSRVRLLGFSARGIARLCDAIPDTRRQLIEALPDPRLGSGPDIRVAEDRVESEGATELERFTGELRGEDEVLGPPPGSERAGVVELRLRQPRAGAQRSLRRDRAPKALLGLAGSA